MATNLTMNPQELRLLDAPVYEIAVSTGPIVVIDNSGEELEVEAIEAGKAYRAYAKAALTLYSPEGTKLAITYADEVPDAPESSHGVSAAPETSERGDTGGNGGSYESRTLDELRELAKERKVKGRAGLSKTELIEALRA